MEQLTTLDAGFLQAEDSDPHASLAIGAVAVLAGPMPDFETLSAQLGERIMTAPRFRQVLRTHPLDLEPPEWVDDEAFDLSHHVRLAALPRPGDDAALNRFVADVMERRLDRDRPLWECWVVDGLAHNRWAVLVKIHHCVADGVAATHLLTQLYDAPVESHTEGRAEQASEGGGREDRRRLPTVSLNPADWVTWAWRTSCGVTSATTQALHGGLDLAAGLLRPAATSSLTGPVSDMRRYATVEVSMADVESVCERFGVTVNDVALAAITDSFRTMLLRRGEKPRRTSLRTLVPVSVRPEDATGTPDNRVSVMLPYLPVDKSDPIQQLRAVHERMTRAKGSGQSQAGSALIAASRLIPFPVTAWAVRALTRLPQRGVVTLATNVPGPRKRVYLAGREVIRLLPVPPLAMQLRTGVAILSYADHLAFGIIGDYDAAPDVGELADGIAHAVSRLAELSHGHWRCTPAGTLALVEGG